MAPRKASRKDSESQNATSNSQGSDPLEASQSQDIDTGEMQKILEQHKQKLKDKRRQRSDAVKAAHQARVRKLEEESKNIKAKHAETIRNIQRPKMERLLELLSKKRELQSQLDSCESRNEAAFLNTAEKMQTAIKRRLALTVEG